MRWPFKRKIPILTPLEGYNKWAISYQHEANPIKNSSDEVVENFLPHLEGKSLLDVGCGTGKFCALAEKSKATKVVGVDLSPAMIKMASANCQATQFICGDITHISFGEEKFDVIICALVLGHVEILSPALSTLIRLLKADGVLIITDFHPYLTLLKSKRTFREKHTGKCFEVEHHLHLLEEYFNIIKSHEGNIEELKEPSWNNTPLVFGLRVRKK